MEYDNCDTGGGEKVKASCLLLVQFSRAHTFPKYFGRYDAFADALVQRAAGARAALMRTEFSAGVIDVRCGIIALRVLLLRMCGATGSPLRSQIKGKEVSRATAPACRRNTEEKGELVA